MVQAWKFVKGPWLLFTRSRAFWLIEVMWDFSRPPIYSTSRSIITNQPKIFISQVILITAADLLTIMVTISTLPFTIRWCHFCNPRMLSSPVNSESPVLYCSGLQSISTPELLKNSRTPLLNVFLRHLVKKIHSAGESVEGEDKYILHNKSILVSQWLLWILSYSVEQRSLAFQPLLV